MNTDRFTAFLQTFEKILKNIKRIAAPVMQSYGLRGGHLSCLLALNRQKEGLTVTDLARDCFVDKALISRLIRELCEEGYVIAPGALTEKNYKKKYVLTPRAEEILQEIYRQIDCYVEKANESVDPLELSVFYHVLSEFDKNIEQISKNDSSQTER